MTGVVGVVLAGGIGKRLWPIRTDKCLLPFGGKPLLRHTTDSLGFAGVRDMLVVVNPANEKEVSREIPRGKAEIVVQAQPKGMGNALLACRRAIRGRDMLVVNAADVVERSLFTEVLREAKTGKATVVIPGWQTEENFPGGYLRLEKGRVVEIVEKPKRTERPSDLVNLVAHFIGNTGEFMGALKTAKSSGDDQYERALSRILKTEPARLVRYKGTFESLKLPWDVLDVQGCLLETMKPRIASSAQIHPTAVIEGSVVIEPKVRVLEHAVIKGPSYIGSRTVIGTGALVLHSMIERDCVVGFGSEVARSYLGKGCWLHTNYVGDSVLEGGNYLGAGAVTANFRFDERTIESQVQGRAFDTGRSKLGAVIGRHARIGVNASLMPGVKVGPEAVIGPGVVAYADVPQKGKLFVRQKQ